MDIKEARDILWNEFNSVSDETIEMMLFAFKLIARQIMEELEKE